MGAKELYEKRKKQGICVYCKKEKAIENRIYCRNAEKKSLPNKKKLMSGLKKKAYVFTAVRKRHSAKIYYVPTVWKKAH